MYSQKAGVYFYAIDEIPLVYMEQYFILQYQSFATCNRQIKVWVWFLNLHANSEMLPRTTFFPVCAEVDGCFLCVSAGWAHVVCALYIPEVEFANVSTMEPIVLQSVPHERYNKVTTYIYAFRHVTISHVHYNGSLNCVFACVCRHVISVRTRAEKVKQPLEPV